MTRKDFEKIMQTKAYLQIQVSKHEAFAYNDYDMMTRDFPQMSEEEWV